MQQTTGTKIVLNYSMSLPDMLTVCEPVAKVDPVAVDVVNEDYFPIKGVGDVLMPFLERLWVRTGTLGADRARSMLKEKGLRPATIPEMLMFTVNHPEEVLEHAIVALSPVNITPTGRFKAWYMEYPRYFVPTILNRTRYHNGSRLERAGTPEIWLAPEQGSWNTSIDWYFAAVPE
jgi:hypothetical protein